MTSRSDVLAVLEAAGRTPWRAEPIHLYRNERRIMRGDGSFVCNIDRAGSKSLPEDEAANDAHATAIVRAVNTFAIAREALQIVIEQHGDCPECGCDACHFARKTLTVMVES